MKSSSLSLRLYFLAVVSAFLALAATAGVLNKQFQDYFIERIYSELEVHLTQLTSSLVVAEDGSLSVGTMPDSRFSMPYSGLYWQVYSDREIAGTKTRVLSRSLWGSPLEISRPEKPGMKTRGSAVSSLSEPLLVSSWVVTVGAESEQQRVLLSVATDEKALVQVSSQFRSTLVYWLALMFIFLVVAAGIQVRVGLQPLSALKDQVQKVRAGLSNSLPENYPKEVQPLASEVNSLLELHRATLSDARSHASDLAHVLKTPLSVVRMLADNLRSDGDAEIADEIENQISAMTHYVERQLARARSNPSPKSPINAVPVVRNLFELIRKLPGERELQWSLDLPERMDILMDEHDLSELLGNILDNTRKWAHSNVLVKGELLPGNRKKLSVHDNGPGVSEDQREDILNRGNRLDTATPGSGLGLTIVRDLSEQHNLDIELDKSFMGGLVVTVSWV